MALDVLDIKINVEPNLKIIKYDAIYNLVKNEKNISTGLYRFPSVSPHVHIENINDKINQIIFDGKDGLAYFKKEDKTLAVIEIEKIQSISLSMPYSEIYDKRDMK